MAEPYAGTCNRIYSPRGVVAHLSYPGWPGGRSLCPVPEPRGGWLGTGRQDEYDRAASLPLCSRCVRLAAERDPADRAGRVSPVPEPAPPGDVRPDSPGQPPAVPSPGNTAGGTSSPGSADADAPVSGAGTKPGPSVPRGERPAGQETGTRPGRGQETRKALDGHPRPGQDQAPVAAVPDEPRVSGPAAVTGPSPAGGERGPRAADDRSPLAGSRTFTIALPPGLPLASLNDRGHWAARYRRSEALKKAAWALALQAKIPRLERVSVVAEYQPGDMRHRDPDNIAASAKAAIDGLRMARCLPEDDSRHVTEVTCRIGSLYPKGRLVLHVTEVAAAGGEVA